MFLTLFISTCVAFLVLGCLLITFRLIGRPMPGWMIPVTIGLSIFGAITYLRYTWWDTMAERMPEDVLVLQTFRESSWYEPWTYLWPRITHFVALDQQTVAAHPDRPGLYLVELLLVAEGTETMTAPQVIDCRQKRRASLTPDTHPDVTALPDTLTWQTGGEPAYLFDAVCSD